MCMFDENGEWVEGGQCDGCGQCGDTGVEDEED